MDLDYIETSDPPVYDNDVDQSKKEKKKDKSGRYVIYTVIFIIILITALVQYSQYRVQIKDFQEITGRNIKAVVDDSYVFNGVEFSLIDGLWYFTLDNPHTKKTYNIPLHYGPKDLVDVPLIGELGEGFSNDDQVYITFLPEDGLTERQSFISLAVAELSLNLRQAINRKIIAACTENNTLACYDREIITCDNTNRAVIFVDYSDETKVEFNDNCIILKGKEKELTKAVDRLLLYWYGILEY